MRTFNAGHQSCQLTSPDPERVALRRLSFPCIDILPLPSKVTLAASLAHTRAVPEPWQLNRAIEPSN